MKNILVIHGFNSGPGEKSETLKKEFPNCNIFTPQLTNDPINDLKTLQDFIENNSNIHIVGTSLGGFYGMYLSFYNQHREDLSFYIINPCYNPFEHFYPSLNQTFNNFKTNTPFTVTLDFLNTLYGFQYELNSFLIKNLPNIYFYFGKNDKVIDFTELKEKLYSFNSPVNIFETEQDHRHENIEKIVEQIKLNSVL
jgi:predicted esterase YcpF (UPF0227 family)